MKFDIPFYDFVDIDILDGLKPNEKLDWGHKIAHLEKIWKLTQGEGVGIAILDTGIMEGYETHFEFKDSVVACRNFTSQDSKNIKDENNHGTFLASIIGARNNGGGVVGIAPKVNLIIGKIGQSTFYESDDLIRGLEWIANEKKVNKQVDVISLSLSTWCEDKKLFRLIDKLTRQGKIIFCSAGNDRNRPTYLPCDTGSSITIPYPGWYPETIAVGAISRQLISDTGPDGDEIDFVAPGVNLWATNKDGDRKEITKGSSFATAYLAGLSALIISYLRKTGYRFQIENTDQMRVYLKQMSIDLGFIGRDEKYGMGLPINWNYMLKHS